MSLVLHFVHLNAESMKRASLDKENGSGNELTQLENTLKSVYDKLFAKPSLSEKEIEIADQYLRKIEDQVNTLGSEKNMKKLSVI